MRWRWIMAVALLGVLGCAGTSTCVVATGQGGYCREDLNPAECEDLSDSQVGEAGSCEALGFSKHCPGESFAFRRPDYSC